eukprot:scaffold5766_cov256-Pinguiococcus_pyrenoidosus.AAC.4
MKCSSLSEDARDALPIRRFCPKESQYLYQPLREQDSVLFIVSLRPLEDEEVFVDYAAVGSLPEWYKRVKGPLAGRKIVS